MRTTQHRLATGLTRFTRFGLRLLRRHQRERRTSVERCYGPRELEKAPTPKDVNHSAAFSDGETHPENFDQTRSAGPTGRAIRRAAVVTALTRPPTNPSRPAIPLRHILSDANLLLTALAQSLPRTPMTIVTSILPA
jgi:hypothetical protein